MEEELNYFLKVSKAIEKIVELNYKISFDKIIERIKIKIKLQNESNSYKIKIKNEKTCKEDAKIDLVMSVREANSLGFFTYKEKYINVIYHNNIIKKVKILNLYKNDGKQGN